MVDTQWSTLADDKLTSISIYWSPYPSVLCVILIVTPARVVIYVTPMFPTSELSLIPSEITVRCYRVTNNQNIFQISTWIADRLVAVSETAHCNRLITTYHDTSTIDNGHPSRIWEDSYFNKGNVFVIWSEPTSSGCGLIRPQQPQHLKELGPEVQRRKGNASASYKMLHGD